MNALFLCLTICVQVTLPLKDFETLWSAAHGEESSKEVSAACESAEVVIERNQHALELKTVYEIVVFHDGVAEIDLGSGHLLQASFGNLLCGVKSSEDRNILVISGATPGRYRVITESVLPLTVTRLGAFETFAGYWLTPSASSISGRINDPNTTVSGPGMLRGGALYAAADSRVEFQIQGQEIARRTDMVLTSRCEILDSMGRIQRMCQARFHLSSKTEHWEPVDITFPASLGIPKTTAPDGVLITVSQDRVRLEVQGESADEFQFDLVWRWDTASEIEAPLLSVPQAVDAKWIVSTEIEGDGLLSLLDPKDAIKLDVLPSWASIRREGVPAFSVTDMGRAPRWITAWSDGVEMLAIQITEATFQYTLSPWAESLLEAQFKVVCGSVDTLSFKWPSDLKLMVIDRNGTKITGVEREGRLSIPMLPNQTQVVTIEALVDYQESNGHAVLPMPHCSAPITDVSVILRHPDEWCDVSFGRGTSAGTSPFSRPRPPGYHVTSRTWVALQSELEALNVTFKTCAEKRRWL
ncbi:MAG: hypothetical protein KDC35_05150 [Acidobacteria bacterium]|nr:hypothetical protein [Acidobacteriota bacterium]